MKLYQFNYTSLNPVANTKMYDVQERTKKALKIVAVLTDYLVDTSKLKLLDLSSSTGIMTQVFSHYFAHVTGIDIDHRAIEYARKHNQHSNVNFFEMDALKTNFPDCSFDVSVCNQMYEHVADPECMISEILRVLKPGGVCYFGATNRWKIIETHYGRIPFLSWLPKKLSHVYLRIIGKGEFYYENLMNYRELKMLVSRFECIDYTKTILETPKRFFYEDSVPLQSFRQNIALFILNRAYWFSPGYVWLLKKSETT